MKLLDREEPMDPRSREELDAVDRALGGATVDAEHAEWAELTALLLDERPEPDEDWAAGLDRAAAAGFPRPGPAGLREKLSGIRPLRIAAPAGALASVLVVAVVALSTLGGEDQALESSQPVEAPSDTAAPVEAEGESARRNVFEQQRLEQVAPEVSPFVEGSDSAAATADESSPASAGAYDLGDLRPYRAATDVSYLRSSRDNGKIAPGREDRLIERDVQLTLSTKPDRVREVSDQAIAITRSLDGIVASSQVSILDDEDRGGGQSSATLQLTIPSRNLDAAIDRLTDLANVDSLNEATEDITRPVVSAQDEVDDAEALRRRLLEALGNATTDEEAESLRLQIEDARRDISKAEAALENIARRARLSDLNVTILGDPNAKEDRGLGDWLDDAQDVLRDLAGVLLISAAILVPLGILVALVWFAVASARRRRRERTLD